MMPYKFIRMECSHYANEMTSGISKPSTGIIHSWCDVAETVLLGLWHQQRRDNLLLGSKDGASMRIKVAGSFLSDPARRGGQTRGRG
jgi:hypothetical protein